MTIIETLAKELNLTADQVEKTVALIDEGNTIPFIARYRKEVTGSLDDSILRTLDERLTALRNLEKRKEEVKNLIDAQGKLTPEIVNAIENAKTVTEVDDIYQSAGLAYHRRAKCGASHKPQGGCISSRANVHFLAAR